jgi:oligoribonuclease NrnB/cAMP/cGMP phosphodiesterase (DHH superfamily)
MDSKLLARVRDLSGADILSELLSARYSGINETMRYFLDLLQSESKKIEKLAKKLEEDPDKDYICHFDLKVNVDGLDYAVHLLKEVSRHANAKATVYR